MTMTLIVSCALLLFTLASVGQQPHITIDAARVLNRTPDALYGSCIEDVNHEVYGGLYDQRLYGESFEEPASHVSYKGWTTLGGEWRIGGGGIPSAAGPGYKLVRSTPFTGDGTMQTTIFFGDRGRSAGLLMRVRNERPGVDQLDGYAVNITRREKRVVLGRYRHDWREMAEGTIPFPPGDSIHLRVRLEGPRIKVYVNEGRDPVIDFTDGDHPLLQGRWGLRTDNDAVRFDNVVIDTGTTTIRDSLSSAAFQNISASWNATGTNAGGSFMLDTVNACGGRQSQLMEYRKDNSRIGIANSGLNHWGIAIQRGQRFEGSVFLRADLLKKPVIVALESADGSRTYARTLLTDIGSSWKEHAFSLTADGTDTAARFALYLQDGRLWVDQASLFSTGNHRFKGLPLRADIAKMMVHEGLRFLRYGGTMVNAPAYRWKNMKGRRTSRPPYKGHWYPYSSNGFGIEEFLAFCEAAGFEPAFAINTEETPEDITDMVQYLTGDASTPQGKARAALGHPQPYKLHYIEIGNEEVIWGDKPEDYDHYAARFNILYEAIHRSNPDIRLVCSAWWRPKSAANMERVFRAINGRAAWWDLHTDADEADAGTAVDRNIQQMQDLFLQWDPGTTMKCAVFEENGGLHNMQRALGHATTLNAVRRHGDFVLTSCPANALQPYRQNDNDWDQGQIFFTPSRVWGMPPFYAQQMAAENHLPLRVASHTDGNLDITATRSEDGRILVIHAVNTTGKGIKATTALSNFPHRHADITVYTLQGALKDENITPVRTSISSPGETVEYTFPAHSYTILRYTRS
jgi:hypothetical protein